MEGTPLQNFGLNKQAAVFLCTAMIAQAILSNRQSLNLPNDKPALQHELVCKVVATSSNTERSAIVIKEGEYLGHLRLANTLAGV